MRRAYHVYMMTNRPGGVLYIGLTNDIARRVTQHRLGHGAAFAARYRCHRLIWAEEHDTAGDAIRREKQLKKWNRAWKIRLIEEANPFWRDLAGEPLA